MGLAGRGARAIFQDRRARGFPVITAVKDQLFAPGEKPSEDNPEGSPKGWLRSRSVWGFVVALGCFIATTVFQIDEKWITVTLQVAEALGIGAGGVYRILAQVPMRR